jgi:nucleotide-binding universal stress UspA family protein
VKDILVLVHDDEGQQARIRCAIDLARAVGGHLHCLGLVQLPVALAFDSTAGASGAAIFLADESARESRNHDTIRKRLESGGVSFEWSEATGDPEPVLAAAIKLVDLVVVNLRPSAVWGRDADLPARLALHGQVPVLAVPDDLQAFDLSAPAVVAWDGSDPADRALRAAIPLLKQSRLVTVVSIGPKHDGGQAELAALYLDRHDCKAVIKRIAAPARPVAQEILAQIELSGAAWFVAGSYGHNPLRERLFGGVTRQLLKSATVPMLLCR